MQEIQLAELVWFFMCFETCCFSLHSSGFSDSSICAEWSESYLANVGDFLDAFSAFHHFEYLLFHHFGHSVILVVFHSFVRFSVCFV